ncbi:hypothetical protein PVAND_007793 [Polypedilum vanderplanki]|uniref:alpha-amylase n=1 Tax=Polypedilum vanderplanki TaxID=319348 RepID=A0A9J6C8H7_POLVA|nr:hypothetical protein PVAND_007793 [Polypedilum vanderplanki]
MDNLIHNGELKKTLWFIYLSERLDIAAECEKFLSSRGFAGVQVSPPAKNVIVRSENILKPWWERYQPVSYKLEKRSGNEAAFVDMVRRCNAVGVRIYVDILLNIISATNGTGTDGTVVSTRRNFPAVPYGNALFIRICELVGLPDLNVTRQNVRQHLIDYMNHLIDLRIADFRADAMKHMFPEDLDYMFSRLRNLNTVHGFAAYQKHF